MSFCEKCESLLKPRYNKVTGERELYCDCCDIVYVFNDKKENYIIRSSLKEERVKTNIIMTDEIRKSLSDVIKIACPKCGNLEAFLFHKPPIWGDEEDVIKYRCVKCNYTWDEGNKVT